MSTRFKAKVKGISAKEGGTVVQLEPAAGWAAEIVELMPMVGMYAFFTVEDGQMSIEDLGWEGGEE